MQIIVRDLLIHDLKGLQKKFTESEENLMSSILMLTALFGFIPLFLIFEICFFLYISNLFKIPEEEFEFIFSGF